MARLIINIIIFTFPIVIWFFWAWNNSLWLSFESLSAIFSGLAFAGLIIAILIQRDELSLQRNELKATREEFKRQNETLSVQRFENTFYNMLIQHNNMFSSFRLANSSFKQVSDILIGSLDELLRMTRQAPKVEEFGDLFDVKLGEGTKNLLWPYLLSLFVIIEFIHRSELSYESKNWFIRILKSQMTRDEFIILYFFGLSQSRFNVLDDQPSSLEGSEGQIDPKVLIYKYAFHTNHFIDELFLAVNSGMDTNYGFKVNSGNYYNKTLT